MDYKRLPPTVVFYSNNTLYISSNLFHIIVLFLLRYGEVGKQKNTIVGVLLNYPDNLMYYQ